MNIAFLNAFGGQISRGAETYVHSLATALTKSAHCTVTVIQSEKTSNSEYNTISIPLEIPKAKGNRLTRLLFLDPESQYIKKFTQLSVPYLKKVIPDIIIPVNNGWQTLLASDFSQKHSSKIIVSSQSGMGRFGPGYDEWANTLFGVDTYICLTTHFQKRLKRFAPWQKTAVIPNGVDLSLFSPKGNTYLHGLPSPVVLIVAAHLPYKQIDLTIQAVSKSKLSPSLLIVGNSLNEYTNYLKQLADKLLPNRHKFITVTHEIMPSVYRSADIFTLCSTSQEAFGICYLEALAANLPVVATNDPQRVEILGAAGILVNPKSQQEYTEAIDAAITRSWSDAPHLQAQRYSYEKIAQRYIDIFKSVL